jgi:DNA repair exonuclease SbcCD ATPase subunit
MRITFLSLTGYIGIHNGLGKVNIEIDFSKSHNKIILIQGANGSGKSTLLGALHPLPDGNSSFVPNKGASKLLRIMNDDTGIWYTFRCIHDVKSNGNRDVSKGYVTKHYPNGAQEELNPNGNISSYKDVVNAELSLDPNFEALSRLSSSNRGLADKTPAERKRFVNTIIDSLEFFNNAHKVLSKKNSIFRNMINNLAYKLDSVGDIDKLKAQSALLNTRYTELNKDYELSSADRTEALYEIRTLDPHGIVQKELEESLKNRDEKFMMLKEAKLLYEDTVSRSGIAPDCDMVTALETLNRESEYYTTSIALGESKIETLLAVREEQSASMRKKLARLESIDSDRFEKLKTDLSQHKRVLSTELYPVICEMGVDPSKISKEEFIHGIEVLTDIKEFIYSVKSEGSLSDITTAVKNIKEGRSYPEPYSRDELISLFNSLTEKYDAEMARISADDGYRERHKLLELRDPECKSETCSFIADAIEAQKHILGYKKRKSLEESITSLLMKIRAVKESIEDNDRIWEIMKIVERARSSRAKAINIINKLPYGDLFLTEDMLYDKMTGDVNFEYFDKLYEYAKKANVIEEYNHELRVIAALESEYNLCKSAMDNLDVLREEIDDLGSSTEHLSKDINTIRVRVNAQKESLVGCRSKISAYSTLISLKSDMDAKTDEAKKAHEINTELNRRSERLKEALERVRISGERCSDVKAELERVNDQLLKYRDTISRSMEYMTELEEYTTKLARVEAVRKYTSPTRAGIQTLFIEIYMNSILKLANDLLSTMFEGRYRLDRFQISESEFRIPCVGNGLPNDDISSMSTSEICMISLIISFTLLIQSSSSYNILRLDEIDGGLDGENRANFLNLISRLNLSQCIMISHNNEFDMSQCDIIHLKEYGGETKDPSANYIYQA